MKTLFDRAIKAHQFQESQLAEHFKAIRDRNEAAAKDCTIRAAATVLGVKLKPEALSAYFDESNTNSVERVEFGVDDLLFQFSFRGSSGSDFEAGSGPRNGFAVNRNGQWKSFGTMARLGAILSAPDQSQSGNDDDLDDDPFSD